MSRYMLINGENQRIYNKFLEFKESFFDRGLSFFDKNIQLFDNDEVFDEFEQRCITNYDSSAKNHEEKFFKQLQGSSAKVRHYFANLSWLHDYPIYDKKIATKHNELKQFLDTYYIEENVEKSLAEAGIASYGNLRFRIYEDIVFLHFFIKEYRKTNSNPHDIIKDINLTKLRNELSDEKFNNVQAVPSRHMLNYLFNPDYYEPIVDSASKRKIVEFFNYDCFKQDIDDCIYQIRETQFGFEDSIYEYVLNNEDNSTRKSIATIIKYDKEDNKSDDLIILNCTADSNEDLFENAKRKLENGISAEELVYQSIKKNVDKKVFVNHFVKYYHAEIGIVVENFDKLIHYSKHYNRYAPFDLISTRGQELIFIEVKSTLGNEIYFSRSEIKFAYKHLDNYQVKVVKDKIIYDIDIKDTIKEVFETLYDNQQSWQCETIQFKVHFNN
ncbi:protein NO VEIN domain-containing protein [Sulfurospirillum deleyianum]|uniref:Protein NO VEIN C-terminal domain-containing protein n=1 Tax=Sulfurospirillum deleyianum (strain ATCC 51133 / DSM 6946 / 5175) TaxID=525898 RepID=D1B114_SULD5|nr:DUF3883 domain-containing protein [Sulfurospirillum deleyianum]ACZ11784.1 hypothetical protein Sdel_0751 [Sulfurospirillum deleyianum DSM 6946]